MPLAAARPSASTSARSCRGGSPLSRSWRLKPLGLLLLAHAAAFSASAVGAAAESSASSGPAFDCRKASSATEKAICASAELSRLDRQQQKAWKAMNSALQEHPQHGALKQDQLAWLKARDRCSADAACITEAYQGRLSQLQGDGSLPWAGVFELPGTGSLALYPVLATPTGPAAATRYRVSLQTAEPKTARWTCEWQGEADLLPASATQPARLQLLMPGAKPVAASLQADGTLEIANDAATQAAADSLCGNGGSFAFRYRRSSAAR